MSVGAYQPAVAADEPVARAGIVDFRADGCASLVRGLEELGFATISHSLELHPSAQPHLFVVAVDGPNEVACAAIRAYRLARSLDGPPVLVISNAYDESAAAAYLAAGATDFFSQPSCGSALRGWCERILHAQREDWLYDQWIRERRRSTAFDRVIVPLGLALFAERDYGRLLEMILLEAKSFCGADGGTLYVRTEDDRLEFTMVHNDTLGISEGGSKGPVTRFEPLPLNNPNGGGQERRYIATYVALTGNPVNLPDVYESSAFDISGTRLFDAQNGYRTQSILAMPLKNQHDRVIGVLQLINARNPMTGEAQPFDSFQEETIASLARLAGSGLESYQRMHTLREQIQALHLEIDEVKKQAQVAQITGSEYFQELKDKARILREKARRNGDT
ncbi:MAG: GAF domain-containing protein [Candidatus Hydrogenedentes bacterium]|nr:GAF domain-containing protein [Candidatus Hydrogenedentota bacterium]